jgi:hypothetical protein
MIKQYSQQYVDLIDLDKNKLISLPVEKILNPHYPALRYIAQVDEGDYLTAIRTSTADTKNMVVTFDELLKRTPFAKLMREALGLLEQEYGSPVDTEFTLEVTNPQSIQPGVMITLLQCRPQSHINDDEAVSIPAELPEESIIFSSRRMVPNGAVKNIRYVLFVTPEGYFSLPSQAARTKTERAIGQLNIALKDQVFICIGPGRWGTSTPDLGVHVAYADIYNTRALIELSGQEVGTSPEPSFGTHFFQDMMEAQIYPLAINLDDKDMLFQRDFFYSTPNRLADWCTSIDENLLVTLRLIDVQDYAPGQHMVLVMDDDEGRAVGFLEDNEEN